LQFSLQYAAPELIIAAGKGANGIEADGAVDVWALGVIAFELLTGTLGFCLPRVSATLHYDVFTVVRQPGMLAAWLYYETASLSRGRAASPAVLF
jgi:serine/threonine protein kinase